MPTPPQSPRHIPIVPRSKDIDNSSNRYESGSTPRFFTATVASNPAAVTLDPAAFDPAATAEPTRNSLSANTEETEGTHHAGSAARMLRRTDRVSTGYTAYTDRERQIPHSGVQHPQSEAQSPEPEIQRPATHLAGSGARAIPRRDQVINESSNSNTVSVCSRSSTNPKRIVFLPIEDITNSEIAWAMLIAKFDIHLPSDMEDSTLSQLLKDEKICESSDYDIVIKAIKALYASIQIAITELCLVPNDSLVDSSIIEVEPQQLSQFATTLEQIYKDFSKKYPQIPPEKLTKLIEIRYKSCNFHKYLFININSKILGIQYRTTEDSKRHSIIITMYNDLQKSRKDETQRAFFINKAIEDLKSHRVVVTYAELIQIETLYNKIIREHLKNPPSVKLRAAGPEKKVLRASIVAEDYGVTTELEKIENLKVQLSNAIFAMIVSARTSPSATFTHTNSSIIEKMRGLNDKAREDNQPQYKAYHLARYNYLEFTNNKVEYINLHGQEQYNEELKKVKEELEKYASTAKLNITLKDSSDAKLRRSYIQRFNDFHKQFEDYQLERSLTDAVYKTWEELTYAEKTLKKSEELISFFSSLGIESVIYLKFLNKLKANFPAYITSITGYMAGTKDTKTDTIDMAEFKLLLGEKLIRHSNWKTALHKMYIIVQLGKFLEKNLGPDFTLKATDTLTLPPIDTKVTSGAKARGYIRILTEQENNAYIPVVKEASEAASKEAMAPSEQLLSALDKSHTKKMTQMKDALRALYDKHTHLTLYLLTEKLATITRPQQPR